MESTPVKRFKKFNTKPIDDGPRNFESRSSNDEDDTGAGTPSLQTTTTPAVAASVAGLSKSEDFINEVLDDAASEMNLNEQEHREKNLPKKEQINRTTKEFKCPIPVPLTRQHRTARLQWCREHHNWTEQDWACVLFSDESRFSLSSDCRRQLIWRESGTAYRPENIQEKDRYPTCSIMV
ncbi:hypothetical protein TNCV_313071 [Trichonephila clavipes]|nr:hypothetical protein TNCV_313071 [Trichonephila clavipes]